MQRVLVCEAHRRVHLVSDAGDDSNRFADARFCCCDFEARKTRCVRFCGRLCDRAACTSGAVCPVGQAERDRQH